jgi:NADPH2:quinone reductase
MRAWLLESFDGLDAVKLGQAGEPVAADGEVVLRVGWAGLNPADRYLSQGQYPARPALPHILGRDAAGIVDSIGAGAGAWKIGDRALLLRSEVGVSRPGTFAEKVAIPTASLARVPEGWTDEQAAGAPLVYLTAYQALTQFGDLPPGRVVLVSGASGGVGVATIQLAQAMGHRVIGLSRSKSKREALLKLGAAAIFDPNTPTWPKQLRAFLEAGAAPGRVDLAIDNIGGKGFNDLIAVLGANGKVSVVGQLAGVVPNFNTASLFFRRITIKGVAVGTYTPEESQAAWKAVVALMDKAGARPLVDHVFEFEQLKEAFERLAQGPLGKVLLRVGSMKM